MGATSLVVWLDAELVPSGMAFLFSYHHVSACTPYVSPSVRFWKECHLSTGRNSRAQVSSKIAFRWGMRIAR